MRTALLAAALGVVITTSLLALAFAVGALGYPNLSGATFWQKRRKILRHRAGPPHSVTFGHPIQRGLFKIVNFDADGKPHGRP